LKPLDKVHWRACRDRDLWVFKAIVCDVGTELGDCLSEVLVFKALFVGTFFGYCSNFGFDSFVNLLVEFWESTTGDLPLLICKPTRYS